MTHDALIEIARARRLGRTGEGRRIREAAAVSVRELATSIGVDPATVWRWESGNAVPKPDQARRWDAALRDLAELVEPELAAEVWGES
jgi:transcriptional regulator with XRE-family HTH domain